MAFGFGDVRKGQFFTPPHICDLMTDLVYGEKIKTDDFITLSEPACGGGGMILAFANRLIKDGYNPAQKMWVEAIDIDRTSALMCYVQLSLWNIPARVIVGNALSLEMKESFFTPAHYLYFWDTKLKRKCANAKELKDDDTAKSNKSTDEIIVPTKPDKKGSASGQLLLFDL